MQLVSVAKIDSRDGPDIRPPDIIRLMVKNRIIRISTGISGRIYLIYFDIFLRGKCTYHEDILVLQLLQRTLGKRLKSEDSTRFHTRRLCNKKIKSKNKWLRIQILRDALPIIVGSKIKIWINDEIWMKKLYSQVTQIRISDYLPRY